MSVAYLAEDPWGMFLYTLAEKLREGAEVILSYNGLEMAISFDVKAIGKMAEVLEKGAPLEEILGIDIGKILAGVPGEELKVTVKSKELELSFTLRGETLDQLRKAFQQNPIDADMVAMIGRLLRIIAW